MFSLQKKRTALLGFALALGVLTLLLRPTPVAAAAPGQGGDNQSAVVLMGQDYTLTSGEETSDVIVFGASAHIGPDARLNGDLVVFGGTAQIQGTLVGDLMVLGGTVEVNGEVTGDVDVMGGSVQLGPKALVHGDVQVAGGSVHQAETAQVLGAIRRTLSVSPGIFFPPLFASPGWSTGAWLLNLVTSLLLRLMRLVVLAALAALLMLLAEAPTRRVGEAIVSYPVESGGVGLLTVFAVPAMAVLLGITLIGLPLSFLGLVALGIAWLYGKLALGVVLGERLAEALKPQQPWPTPLNAALGTALLEAVIMGANLIPCIGWVIGLAVGCLGLGAVLLTRGGTQPYQRTPRSPGETPQLPAAPAEETGSPPEEN